MNSKKSLNFRLQCTLAAVGILAGSGLALAQPADEITITGVRASRVVGRSPTTGAPIEEMSLTRKVSYSDLDLTTHLGATELEKRVNDTAKALCQKLDQLSPLSKAQGPSCVKQAADAAMVQAHAAIAAAEQRVAEVGVKK